jgi:hypothetical protein
VSRIAGQITPPRGNRLESRESFGSAFEYGRSVSRDFSVKESPVRGKRIVFKDAGIEVQIGADKEVHVSPVQPTKSIATSSPHHTPPLPPKSIERTVLKDAGIEVQIGTDKEVHIFPVQPTKSSAASSSHHTPPLPPKSLEKSSEQGRETCSCTVS